MIEFYLYHKGKKYSTRNSIEIASASYDEDNFDITYSKQLYKTKWGDYFFLLCGGPDSPCGLVNEKGEKFWGSRLIPTSKEEAEEFLKEEGVVLLGC